VAGVRGGLFAVVCALGFLVPSNFVSAAEPIRIEIGRNYERYSNDELRRRVYDLERAVAQLQDQVFHLSIRERGNPTAPARPAPEWTCSIQSFGKTHVATGNTRASAIAQVLKKCSDASSAIHCQDSDAKCDDK
jgi:hypothetical protein